MQAPDFREHIALTDAESAEFERLTSIFELPEEHIADPRLLVRYYSS